jgi:hypothetical protein
VFILSSEVSSRFSSTRTSLSFNIQSLVGISVPLGTLHPSPFSLISKKYYFYNYRNMDIFHFCKVNMNASFFLQYFNHLSSRAFHVKTFLIFDLLGKTSFYILVVCIFLSVYRDHPNFTKLINYYIDKRVNLKRFLMGCYPWEAIYPRLKKRN